MAAAEAFAKLPLPRASNTIHAPKPALLDMMQTTLASNAREIEDPFELTGNGDLFGDGELNVEAMRFNIVTMMARPYGQDEYMTFLGAPPSYRGKSGSNVMTPHGTTPTRTESVSKQSTSKESRNERTNGHSTSSKITYTTESKVPPRQEPVKTKLEDEKTKAFRNSLVRKKKPTGSSDSVSKWENAISKLVSSSCKPPLALDPEEFAMELDDIESETARTPSAGTLTTPTAGTTHEVTSADITPTSSLEMTHGSPGAMQMDTDDQKPVLMIRFKIPVPVEVDEIESSIKRKGNSKESNDTGHDKKNQKYEKQTSSKKEMKQNHDLTPESSTSSSSSTKKRSDKSEKYKQTEKAEKVSRTNGKEKSESRPANDKKATKQTASLSMLSASFQIELSPEAQREQQKMLSLLAEEDRIEKETPSYRKAIKEAVSTQKRTMDAANETDGRSSKRSRTSAEEREHASSSRNSPSSKRAEERKPERSTRPVSLSLSGGDRGRDRDRDRSPVSRRARRSASPSRRYKDRSRSRSRTRRDSRDDETYRSYRRRDRSRSRSRDRSYREKERARRNSDDRDTRRVGGIDRYVPSVKESPATSHRTPDRDATILTPSGSAASRKPSPFAVDATPTLVKAVVNSASKVPSNSKSDTSTFDYNARGKQLKAEAESSTDSYRRTFLFVGSLMAFMSNQANIVPGDISEDNYEDRLMRYHSTTRNMMKFTIDRCSSRENFQGFASLLCFLDAHFLHQIIKNLKKALSEKVKLLKNLEKLAKEEDADEMIDANIKKIKGQIADLNNTISDRLMKMNDRLEEYEQHCHATDSFRTKYAFPNLGGSLPAVMSIARKIFNSFIAECGIKDLTL